MSDDWNVDENPNYITWLSIELFWDCEKELYWLVLSRNMCSHIKNIDYALGYIN
jgi:hypothetical protein